MSATFTSAPGTGNGPRSAVIVRVFPLRRKNFTLNASPVQTVDANRAATAPIEPAAVAPELVSMIVTGTGVSPLRLFAKIG
ncbi:MAG TPA: hypothetical protein VNI54_04180 [Thermoanaerobaculia bacterium]|nr:hypothetical protein [Thermoanaerobaculia bacterium]